MPRWIFPSCDLWPWTTYFWLSWTNGFNVAPLRLVSNVSHIYYYPFVNVFLYLICSKLFRSPKLPRHSVPSPVCNPRRHSHRNAWRGNFTKVIWHCIWCHGMYFLLYEHTDNWDSLAVHIVLSKGRHIRTNHSGSLASNNQRCLQRPPCRMGMQIPWAPARYCRWGTSNRRDRSPVSNSKFITWHPLPDCHKIGLRLRLLILASDGSNKAENLVSGPATIQRPWWRWEWIIIESLQIHNIH